MEKKLTKQQIDKQILDHADEIVRLMKMQGFNPNKESFGLTTISIHCWENGNEVDIDVESVLQHIRTHRRKMK